MDPQLQSRRGLITADSSEERELYILVRHVLCVRVCVCACTRVDLPPRVEVSQGM